MTATLSAETFAPLSALHIDDKANVRRIGRGADAAFIASVRTHGIQMPLIVRPNGKGYLVTDGGKRLEAAFALVKDGTWKADTQVPVKVMEQATDTEARECSLTANTVRQAMHPVDEYRAFAGLELDAPAIAARFGLSEHHVKQRLALGALDASILDAWRDGKIDARAAQAFTLATPKDQVAIFKRLSKQGTVRDYNIKRELFDGQENVARLLNNVVSVEDYQARGGVVVTDLFGGDHVVSNPELLKTMAQETVEETCKKLTADGWAWVRASQPEYQFGRIQMNPKPTSEEKRKIAELSKRIDKEDDDYQDATDELDALQLAIALRSVTEKQKAASGCFVYLNHDSTLSIDYGRTEPKAEAAGKSTAGKGDAATTTAKIPTKAALTQVLTQRLNEQRLTAIKNALISHPYRDEFTTLLGRIIASQIAPASRWNALPSEVDKHLDAIVAGIAPKVASAAFRKAFDAKDYFASAPKSFVIAAIAEAVNADEARKMDGQKRSEIAKFAMANVVKTGWLPKELRTVHYDGPQAKAKAKSAAKTKTAAKGK